LFLLFKILRIYEAIPPAPALEKSRFLSFLLQDEVFRRTSGSLTGLVFCKTLRG